MKKKLLSGLVLVSAGIVAIGYNACSKVSFDKQLLDSDIPLGWEEKIVSTDISKLDILLVVDNSTSMLADNRKLASRLGGFVENLKSSKVDWQMCITTTSFMMPPDSFFPTGSRVDWGSSVKWSSYSPGDGKTWILDSSTGNLQGIISNTIEKIGVQDSAGDERGIKAAYHHFLQRNDNNCYRSDAKLAVIVISDEDEASVAGDVVLKEAELKIYRDDHPSATQAELDAQSQRFDLKLEDSPQKYLDSVKNAFSSKQVNIHSIITESVSCKEIQDNIPDEKGYISTSYIGTVYKQASQLTGGGVGSICDNDYTETLGVFRNITLNSKSEEILNCEAESAPEKLAIKVTPYFATSAKVEGNKIIFNPAIPEGYSARVRYVCKESEVKK